MKMFNPFEKEAIINEFKNRKGMYSRLYDKEHRYGDGYGEPIGIMYRCESIVEKDRVIILRYTWNTDSYLSKSEFENNKIKGMAIALKKADRYLTECKKKNIEVKDFCEIDFKTVNEKMVDDLNKNTKKYIDVFMNRIEKYYKKPMKVIVLWM